MKIWLRINALEPISSWVIVWQELVKALKEVGHTVHSDLNTIPPSPEEYIEFWWGDPIFWEWSPETVLYRVGYALSEARSLYKKSFAIKGVQKCNLLLCPSFHASIAFLEAPIDIPIEIVPFGVDTKHYHYVDRSNLTPFKFLHLGAAQFRKGSWLVPEAFIKTFTRKEPVHLTISSFHDTEMARSLEKEYGGHPNITFNIKMEPDSFPIYQQHHVLVSPHLSEGWGMCITEAMSTGMACLVARCYTPREFFRPDFGWWIEMSEDYAPVSNCLPGTGGLWRIPDIESLAAGMRYAADHPEEVISKGKAASAYIGSNYTWELTAEKITSILSQYVFGSTMHWQ